MMHDIVEKGSSYGVLGAAIGWIWWVTKKSFGQDTKIARVETKIDMLLDHFGVNKKEKD